MNTITVCGPLNNEQSARDTVKQMGEVNHSVFEQGGVWFVERHLDVTPDRIFGYAWSEIQAKQMKR